MDTKQQILHNTLLTIANYHEHYVFVILDKFAILTRCSFIVNISKFHLKQI